VYGRSGFGDLPAPRGSTFHSCNRRPVEPVPANTTRLSRGPGSAERKDLARPTQRGAPPAQGSGELEADHGSTARGVFDEDPAAMYLGHVLDDGETQTRPWSRLGLGRPVEPFEHQ
jgi:hypothetical protein